MKLFVFVAFCLKIVVPRVKLCYNESCFHQLLIFLLIIDFQGACVVEIVNNLVKGPELVSLDSKKFQAHKVMNLRNLIQVCGLFHRRRVRVA